jgi:hypothetical protein
VPLLGALTTAPLLFPPGGDLTNHLVPGHTASGFTTEPDVPTIELTSEQRQAIQAKLGQPVDVVDPATQQR